MIVASAGNESDDLGHPTTDDISPDWPPDSTVEREVRTNCRGGAGGDPGRGHRVGRGSDDLVD